MAISKEQFVKVTNIVIDKMEGGYYHPDMLLDGRVKDSRYASSGETMFGIDRVAGGTINYTPEGRAFWKVIDDANARKNWKWNYLGGSLNSKLKDLASEVMYPVYVDNSKRYLSEEASKIVDSDPRLVFNFSYASWNGSGWFQRFAKPINEAVKKGIKNPDKLIQIAIESRTKSSNSLIKQGGTKIESFIEELKVGGKLQIFFLKRAWESKTGKVLIISTATILIGGISYLILTKNKK